MRYLISLVAVTLSFNLWALEAWNIDSAHSAGQFKIKHMMVSNVTGTITGIEGKVWVDDKDATKTKFEATLDPSTIHTANAKRDAHLKDPDFFDVKKYPKMSFKSKKVTAAGDKLTVTGDLTIHGVTKELTLTADPVTAPVKDAFGGLRRGFSATTQINRKDYGLTWNKVLEAGGVALGDTADVQIDLELTAEKKTPKS